MADREGLIKMLKKAAPAPIAERVSLAVYNLKYSVGGYFKAQFQIMLVIWAILVLGFMILGIDFNFILSLMIAFLDFLPFFGTGTTGANVTPDVNSYTGFTSPSTQTVTIKRR